MNDCTDTQPSRPRAAMLRWLGAVGIAIVIVVRLTTIFAPQIVFDVDPATDPSSLGLGPAGSLGLDVLLLLSAAIALLGETLSGRRIDLLPCLLVVIPLPILIVHGVTDAHDLWRGSTWLAAMVAAVAIAHLQRDRAIRLAFTAVLIASVIPLLARGLMQVTIEHQETLRAFEQTRDQFFADRGWPPDSSAARIFERRLHQPQPTGWFPTSNVLATIFVTTAVVWLGLGIAAVRRRLPAGLAGVAFTVAIAALGGIALTGSKGAIATALLGVALILLPLAFPRLSAMLRTRAAVVTLSLIALAFLGIIVRGAVLPEGFAGEKSLLFRWHYLQGAMAMFTDAPFQGVGPDGFQAAYELHRPARSPEEVTSAHSVFVDWLAMLGLTAVVWIAFTLSLVWRAAGRVNNESRVLQDDVAPTAARFSASVFGVAMVAGFAVEWDTMTVSSLRMLVWIFSMGGAMIVAGAAARILEKIDGRIVNWAMLVGVTVLMVHTQIEMTFWQPGAIVWCMALLATAAGVRPVKVDSPMVGRAAGGGAALLAMMVLIFAFIPAWRQQRLVSAAAHQLFVPEVSPATTIERRDHAVALLTAANEHWPINAIPLRDAARQAALSAGRVGGHERDRIARLETAGTILDRAIAKSDDNALLVERINIRWALYQATGDVLWLWDAMDDAERLTERSPHAIGSWKRLGDLLWELEVHDAARSAYARALANDANFELDELKQLSNNQRTTIQARMTGRSQPDSDLE